MVSPKKKSERDLGRRERQILDVIYELESGSVGDVRRRMPEPPSYSAVRTMMTVLESKGFLKHTRVGTKYVYAPTRSRHSVSRSSLRHLIKTFFSGSPGDAVAAILDSSAGTMSAEELQRLADTIERARQQES